MRKTALGAALFVAAAIPVVLGSKASAETVQKQVSKPKVVVVRPGDSLSKIAKRNGTTYPRIFYANKSIKHPDVIYPDDELRIPRKGEKLNKRPLPADAQVPVEQPSRHISQDSTNHSYESSNDWKPATAQSVPAHAVSGSVWDKLAACESGGNWSINTGNGYYGGLQFTLSTWRGVGGSGYPHQASKAEQIKRAQILQARSGWGQWPACTAKLGLR